MEIYKRTSKSPLDEKFKELLNAETAKNKIEDEKTVEKSFIQEECITKTFRANVKITRSHHIY